MIKIIKINNYTIKAILKLNGGVIIRYFKNCLDYTNYIKNNKNVIIVNASREYH